MNKQQVKSLTDNELSLALQDINDTSRLHDYGTPYYDKLLSDYNLIIEEMGHRCVIEYRRRYQK
jgi:hypothetical protein